MKIIEIKCSNCNNHLDIPEKIESGVVRCLYCSTPYYFDKESNNFLKNSGKNIQTHYKKQYQYSYKPSFFGPIQKLSIFGLLFSFLIFLYYSNTFFYFLDIGKYFQIGIIQKILCVTSFLLFILSTSHLFLSVLIYYVKNPKHRWL